MNIRACSRETEVRELMARGHWPEACTEELRAHVRTCHSCGDLVLVTQAFRSARASSIASAPLAAPGVIWWRAQLRRRNAAVERVARPIFSAQVFALSMTVIIAAGLVISQARHGVHWLSWLANWMAGLSQSQAFRFDVLLPLSSSGMSFSNWIYWKALSDNLIYIIPVLIMLAFLSGMVVYLRSQKH